MRLFFASVIILFIRNILHINRLQKLTENKMAENKRDNGIVFFSSLTDVFSRATGLTATVIKVTDGRLPDCYAGAEFFSLPLVQSNKICGYIIFDHRAATDNNHRSAAIRLLHFIVSHYLSLIHI